MNVRLSGANGSRAAAAAVVMRMHGHTQRVLLFPAMPHNIICGRRFTYKYFVRVSFCLGCVSRPMGPGTASDDLTCVQTTDSRPAKTAGRCAGALHCDDVELLCLASLKHAGITAVVSNYYNRYLAYTAIIVHAFLRLPTIRVIFILVLRVRDT